ncbi:MAG: tetratricopeptide repeat protein [Candidatus Omnitrophica bacterium]|nr:tetratricopeptide repeat protein [Candidatus Omnitrophota bacterium]
MGVILEAHWLVFSNIGFFCLAAMLFHRSFPGRIFLKKLTGVCVVLALVFGTQVYNQRWRTEIGYLHYWKNIVPEAYIIDFLLGVAYMEKDSKKAEHYLQSALSEENIVAWDIYANLGVLATNQQEYQKAYEYHQKAYTLNPHSEVAANNLGVVLLNLDRTEEAKSYFEKALALNRFTIEPRTNLALILEREGNHQRATQLLLENISIDPYDETVKIHYLRLLLNQQTFDQARRIVREYLDEDYSSGFYCQLALHCITHEQWNIARDLFLKSIQRDRSNVLAYLEFGKLLANRGLNKEARQVWLSGIEHTGEKPLFEEYLSKLQDIDRMEN